ncbi:MAG: excinuclease ABC subunit UvrC [Nitrospirae bacterium]|nr:excinuclease ABC subunit UvrC [Nitrospirota bacterium]
MDIKEKLGKVPSSPGIYIFKAAREKVIYVGKAKNLRNRLRSYFQDSSALGIRKAQMVKEVKDFDYIVTDSELEALVLEANYVKRLKPRYNIILRDDKNYPYLKLTITEEWPRLEVARRIAKDGSLYFGPYVPTGIMWETLKFIRRNFPIRKCRYNLEKPFRPCIQYQLGRCLAPCAEDLRCKEDHKKYTECVNEVKLFLLGERRELLENLQKRMEKFSEDLRFEDAAKLRDRIRTLERLWETQRVISPELGDMDVIGVFRQHDGADVFMLFIRNGMVIGQKDFFLKKLKGLDDEELIADFIGQFYSKEMLIPQKIILPLSGDFKTQSEWLSRKKGETVSISSAGEAKESEVLNMANENAYHSFLRHKEVKPDEVLLSIKKLLNLKAMPRRIEAVDVSNISGAEAVGAVISWEDGRFVKDNYRLFKIKTVTGIDDFAMIGEVVGRHFKSLSEKGEGLPNLMLIDGGRGQLQSALKAIEPFKLPIEIAAIAKEKRDKDVPDRIYLPQKTEPVILEPHKTETHLLQRIRDEVHRFAISYHKKLRAKRTLESPLEKIKGIGKKRRLELLRQFGGVEDLRKATVDDIAGIKGFNRKMAEKILEGLEGRNQ